MPRSRLLFRVVLVVLCLVLVAVPVPAWAAPRAISPEVSTALERWESSVPAVRDAAHEVQAAEQAVEPARQAVAEATRARDEMLARLEGHDAEVSRAQAAVGETLAELRQAARRLAKARRDLGAAEQALGTRSSESRDAGGVATAPDVLEESRIREGQGRARLDRAIAERREATAEQASRQARVHHARREREAMGAGRASLEDALAGSGEALDAAVDEQEARAATVEARHRDLAERQAAHDAALAAVRGLGWRAGVLGRGGLVWPTDGPPGSRFGNRRHPISRRVRLHAGVDVPAPTGQTVVATASGTVTAAGRNGGYGFMVDVAHGNGRTSRYAHLSYISVRPGERVEQAQRIGKIGSTGGSTGPHLHFEVRVHDHPRDPLHWFAGVIGG